MDSAHCLILCVGCVLVVMDFTGSGAFGLPLHLLTFIPGTALVRLCCVAVCYGPVCCCSASG